MSETFEAHGKTWTPHVPGDLMPVDGATQIHVLARGGTGSRWSHRADSWFWGTSRSPSEIDVIGWRYPTSDDAGAFVESNGEPSELEKLRAENEAMREAILEAHDALSMLDDCNVMLASSVDIDINATDACSTARAKLKPFLS